MTTIAFIDDEVNILNSIQRLLRKQDWELLAFSSPEEAIIELDKRRDVDIIVSDYRMPNMNGVEVLNILKHISPGALRIILSGQADLNGVLAAINQAEIYRFITKPWIDGDFIITLEKAVQYHALVQENLRLLHTVKQQQQRINEQLSELKRLERETPGITQVKLDEEGAIDLSDEFGCDVDK